MRKVLCILNYYYPYVSGVSEYARVMCEKMAREGYDVTVVTSNHAKLAKNETINGVKVVRAAVICRISKGTISPEFIYLARKYAKSADVVWLHLPMIESGLLSCLIDKKKIVCMYHCDVNLPGGFLNKFIVKVMDMSNRICLKRCRKVLVTSIDYGKHSRGCKGYEDKLVEAGAPIKEYEAAGRIRTEDQKIIGFCGRIVQEKGIDVLLDAFQQIRGSRTDVMLKIGGDYQNVAGGSIYPALKEKIARQKIENVQFLGKIPDEKMGEFYSGLDVFVLPSINSLEAFGMVQIEAMMCGTPVVATDLYGVRTIAPRTGMGVVVRKKDPKALAAGILEVLDHPQQYRKTKEHVQKFYGTQKCFETVDAVFRDVVS